MNKNILIVVTGLLIISAGWYFYNVEKYEPSTYVKETSTGSVTVNTETGTSTEGIKPYAMEEVILHKDASSCYSVINNQVYDLTAWVNMHPGGKGPILSICGNDGTEKFMKKHKGGEKFMMILGRYKIGTLTK